MLMIFNIFFDYIFGQLVPYCLDKMAIFPKLASPQLLLDLGKHLENSPGRLPFQTMYNLGNRISRRKTQKYRNMIYSNFYCLYFKFIGLGNLLRTFFLQFHEDLPSIPICSISGAIPNGIGYHKTHYWFFL